MMNFHNELSMKKPSTIKPFWYRYKNLASKGQAFRGYFFAIMILLVVSLCVNVIVLVRNYEKTRVAFVIDGDSFELKDGRRIRLLGLDAPELGRLASPNSPARNKGGLASPERSGGGCMANEAKDSLKKLVLGKHVRLKNIVTDDYGRQLANVIIEDFPTWVSYMRWRFGSKPTQFPIPDPMVNRYMVSHGFAKFAGGDTPYRDTIQSAREYAKQNKLGIYSDQCRGPSGQVGCEIKGNIRQEKKVYYILSCKTYDQVVVDQSFGDMWFCSGEEASAAGFSFSTSYK